MRNLLRNMSEDEFRQLQKELEKNDEKKLLPTDTVVGYKVVCGHYTDNFDHKDDALIAAQQMIPKSGDHNVNIVERRIIFTTGKTRYKVRGQVIEYNATRAVASVKLEDGSIVGLHTVGYHPAVGDEIIGTLMKENGLWHFVDARPYKDGLEKFRRLLSYLESKQKELEKEVDKTRASMVLNSQHAIYSDVSAKLKELLK